MAEIGSTNPLRPPLPVRPVADRREPPRRRPKQEDEDKDKSDKRDEDDGAPHIDEYA